MSKAEIDSLYNAWNGTPNIHHHKIWKDRYGDAIAAALREDTVQELHDAIFNYGRVLGDKRLLMKHKWTIREFFDGANSNQKGAPKNYWKYLEDEFDIDRFHKVDGWENMEPDCDMDAIEKLLEGKKYE